ncbi:phage tail tape measure protein [Pelobium manganitolerans]|uniref:phage tail tape measure protein n=1 Tax=Pelobium manganitolerans TaxID=1842495 RepID=UPI003FA39EA1
MNAKVQLILELKDRIKSGMGNAKKYVNQNVKDIKDRLNSLKDAHVKTFSAMKDQVPGLGNAIALLTNPYALATAAVLALGTAYYKSVQMAAEWEKGMAKINVTAQLSRSELGMLSEKVREIGANSYVPLEEVPNAFNKIISAGLDVKTALSTLDPVLKATKAGFADIDTVAAATVNTMNSTGLKDANEVLDVLFATLNKGNAEFNDIANYLPKILPMAQKAGVSFKDTAGAFAYLTAQGFKAEAASTGLLNSFKAISDPAITKNLKQIGVNVYDAQGKTKPFVNIIGDLKKQLDGLTDEQRAKKFKIAGFDAEATTAIGAMLTDFEKLGEIVEFTNNSQGELNEALKNAQTPMDVWMLVSNQVKSAMIGIGQTGLPIIKTIGQYVLNVITYFKNLYNSSTAFRDSLKALGTLFEYTFAIAIAPLKFIYNMFILIGDAIGWVAGKLGLGTGSFESFYLGIRPYLLWIKEVIGQIANIWVKFISGDFTGAYKAFKNFELPNMDELRERSVKKADPENPFSTDPKPDDKPKGTPAGGAANPAAISENKITGGGQKTNNITVNIDAFNKGGINAGNTQGIQGMSASDVEKWFNEMLLRAIRNLETSYS